MATVIIGAGIIGSSTAYYLSQAPSTSIASSIHIVESSPELFASASGYAAGFLARDWFGPATAALGALSFDLHKQLAKEYKGSEKWGYYRSIAISLQSVSGKRGDEWLRRGASRVEAAKVHEPTTEDAPAWLRQKRNGKLEVISEGESTAQVDPLRLSKFLLTTAVSRGVHLHQPFQPRSVNLDPTGDLSTITLVSSSGPPQTMVLPCSRLIITAGAWTPRVVRTLFPHSTVHLPITSLAGHSLVLRSPRWEQGDELGNANGHYQSDLGQQGSEEEGCHAVFTTEPNGWSPEIFSRAGGEIYIAGLNDAGIPLPELATGRKIDPACIAVLKNKAKELLGKEVNELGAGTDLEDADWDLEILREGLCFRPVGPRGVPFLGKLNEKGLGGVKTKDEGVWIAAGHGPWGISMSLGTGLVMAEMIEGRPTSADIRNLGVL